MLPAGSQLDVSIQAQSTLKKGYSAILSDLAARLPVQNVAVLTSTAQASGFFDQVLGGLTLSNVPFVVNMRVVTNVDFDKPNDVLAVIEHELYEATGEDNYPTAGCVTAINGDATDCAGQVGPGGKKPESSLSDIVADFFKNLSSTAKTILYVIAGILILVLLIVAFGPNVPSVAKAAAIA